MVNNPSCRILNLHKLWRQEVENTVTSLEYDRGVETGTIVGGQEIAPKEGANPVGGTGQEIGEVPDLRLIEGGVLLGMNVEVEEDAEVRRTRFLEDSTAEAQYERDLCQRRQYVNGHAEEPTRGMMILSGNNTRRRERIRVLTHFQQTQRASLLEL